MKKMILMLFVAAIPSMMSAQMNILSDNISFVGKTEIKKGDDAIVKSVRYAPTDEDAPNSYILDSSVLKPGVYVIRATVGNNTYTAKLTPN